MVEMIETALRRACRLRWRRFRGLRAGEWRLRGEIAVYGRFSERRGMGSGGSMAERAEIIPPGEMGRKCASSRNTRTWPPSGPTTLGRTSAG